MHPKPLTVFLWESEARAFYYSTKVFMPSHIRSQFRMKCGYTQEYFLHNRWLHFVADWYVRIGLLYDPVNPFSVTNASKVSLSPLLLNCAISRMRTMTKLCVESDTTMCMQKMGDISQDWIYSVNYFLTRPAVLICCRFNSALSNNPILGCSRFRGVVH